MPCLFYSYLSEHNKQQIEAMLKKARRWQLVNTNFEFQELAENHMLRLFRQSKSNSHSLNHLYEINSNERVGTLRQRGHNFMTTKYELTTKSFILRCLRLYRQLCHQAIVLLYQVYIMLILCLCVAMSCCCMFILYVNACAARDVAVIAALYLL